MKHYLRIITANMCNEYPGKKKTLLNKWIKILCKMKGDIIFLQEIHNYNFIKLVDNMGLKILNINNMEEICVLINPNKLTIIDNNNVKIKSSLKTIYIGGIHLDDIPSLTHHMNNMLYNGSEIIPLSYSLQQILQLCSEKRLPRIKEELNKVKNIKRVIIAGDFNEPSHLDLDNINTPISKEFEKHGFIDTYRYINKKENGYTWPSGVLYKKEPPERIDMIYTKNLKVTSSSTYDEIGNKWLSDHKMVITDIIV